VPVFQRDPGQHRGRDDRQRSGGGLTAEVATAVVPAPGQLHDGYRVAFSDWLACACGGAGERAALAARTAFGAAGGESALSSRVAFAATAGHVLDFDDTLSDGVAHISATTAPVALLLTAAGGGSVGEAIVAFAAGFEATAAVASASHPALYDGGWHPTAVCGPVGAAVAASLVLGLPDRVREEAVTTALLRAGGTRGAFGSDGKALQVAMAALSGLHGALLAQAGAHVDRRAAHGPHGFDAVLGAAWPDGLYGADRDPFATVARRDGGFPASGIARNWIKLHPSCLGTHAPIDAAERLRTAGAGAGDAALDGGLEVAVNTVGRQAAHLDEVVDGLEAKFSIPYCVAYTLAHGRPGPADFGALDAVAARRATAVSVVVDDSLPQWGAVLSAGGRELARVDAPRGAPGSPLTTAELEGKVRALAGERLIEALSDLQTPAADVVRAAGLDG
jgi:2-methylcitrate dehydratase PrpD